MTEYDGWLPARFLFREMVEHAGPQACAKAVAPWLKRAQGAYSDALMAGAELLCGPTTEGDEERRTELRWELYALSRVSDVLLLPFQPPLDLPGDTPYAHTLHPLERFPALPMEQYLELFTGLGMAPFEDARAFDPFLHEIVDVEQAESPDEPIRITEVVWPGLWLGPLLFSRAGVRVRAGVRHAERGVADRSPLYWAFLRRHRPTVDLSQGWGHNSQWRTEFRVDHCTPAGECLNAGGPVALDGAEAVDDEHTALLTAAERRELLRHRCLIRMPAHAAGTDGAGEEQVEFWPFDWRIP